jgi:hypothetical protein
MARAPCLMPVDEHHQGAAAEARGKPALLTPASQRPRPPMPFGRHRIAKPKLVAIEFHFFLPAFL